MAENLMCRICLKSTFSPTETMDKTNSGLQLWASHSQLALAANYEMSNGTLSPTECSPQHLALEASLVPIL